MIDNSELVYTPVGYIQQVNGGEWIGYPEPLPIKPPIHNSLNIERSSTKEKLLSKMIRQLKYESARIATAIEEMEKEMKDGK